MNLTELMKKNRADEMKAIMRFIAKANIEELAKIINEIRTCHDNLMAWNENTRLLTKVGSVSLNGECIQLNIEKEANGR